MKVYIGKYKKNGGDRTIRIRIDDYDVWSMDHTLALIIFPMLKKLKEKKHGAPIVDNEDVPEYLRGEINSETGESDEHFFARWDYVLDEITFAFEQLASDDYIKQFFNKDRYDKVGHEQLQKRIDNGCRLFGKYFQSLWD